MENEDNITGMIKELKNSPLYAMSLGGRELYHSNFWEWLMKKDKEFIKAFGIEDVDNTTVTREEKHHDLTIHTADGKIYIIENKIKSLASQEQLDRYLFDMFKSYIESYKEVRNNKSFEDEQRVKNFHEIKNILLYLAEYINGNKLLEAGKKALLDKSPGYIRSLFEESSTASDSITDKMILTGISQDAPSFLKDASWKYKTYSDIAREIKSRLKQSSIQGTANEKIVEQYCDDVQSLSFVVNSLLTDSVANYNFDNSKKLECIRFDDTYKKLKMYNFSENIILKEIEEKIKEKHIDIGNFTLKKDVDFANKKANLTIKVEYQKNKKKYALGIQIEEYDFRYFVECPDLAKDVEKEITETGESASFEQFIKSGWFINPKEIDEANKESAFHNKKLATQKYPCNKYDPDFIYQYYKLTEDMTYKKLRDAIYDVFKSNEFKKAFEIVQGKANEN